MKAVVKKARCARAQVIFGSAPALDHQATRLVGSRLEEFHIRIGISGNNSDRQTACREHEFPIYHAQAIGSDSHRLVIASAHAPRMLSLALRFPCLDHAHPSLLLYWPHSYDLLRETATANTRMNDDNHSAVAEQFSELI
jgi:hypothetical protein